MGKTYRKEKDKYAKREARDTSDKQQVHERDRTERRRKVHEAEVHWQDDNFQEDFD